jgi:Leucine-rich repeat (LRR) protein
MFHIQAYNRITSIPPNAFSQLRVLSYLTFSDNRLATIPSNAFTGLISLTHFEFDNCNLLNLDPAWFADLREAYDVRLDGNNLRSLPRGIFAPLDKLSVLTLNGNRIRNLNSNAFGNSLNSLRLLYANGNGIRAVDDEILTRGQNLMTLQLTGNNCISQNFFNVQGNLEAVRAALGECFRMFAGFISCNYVRVRNDYICHMTIQNPKGEDFYYIPGAHMDNLTNSDVRILDAMRQETIIIPSTICRQFPNLVDLYIDESFVESINEDAFEHCRNLEWLDLYGNAITSIPDFTFSNSPRLLDLYLLQNEISTIGPNAFAGTVLEMISLDQNALEIFDPRWLDPVRRTMKYLYMTNNRIREIPDHAFDGMINLELLGMGSNQLSELPSRLFHDLANLKYIWLHLNQFTSIEVEWFERLSALEFVSFYRNQIQDIPAHVFR